jgi:hypothetical protein
MNTARVNQKIDFNFDRKSKLYLPDLRVVGTFDAICERPDKSIRWAQLGRVNGVVNEGFNLMLNSMFRSGSVTPIANWYIGLISNSGYSSLNAADTMASHAGWTENSTQYTLSNRPQWSPGAASNKSLTNSSPVNFPMNADNVIIKGIFVTSDNTLAGTTGTLWAHGLFSGDQTLYNGDTLKITYTVTLS